MEHLAQERRVAVMEPVELLFDDSDDGLERRRSLPCHAASWCRRSKRLSASITG
jgi:hypothetical protein